jgi:hypothetical protein
MARPKPRSAAENSESRKKVRVSVSFSSKQYAALLEAAKAHRVSVAWVVRDAVDAYWSRKRDT